MRSNSTLSLMQREAAVAWFESGLGYKATATALGVRYPPVKRIYQRWRVRGRGALMPMGGKGSFRVYPFEVKLEAVTRFIAGDPAVEVAQALNISNPSMVPEWAKRFREQGEAGLRVQRKARPKLEPEPTDENERLQREVERLQAEVAYLKKLRALRGQESEQS